MMLVLLSVSQLDDFLSGIGVAFNASNNRYERNQLDSVALMYAADALLLVYAALKYFALVAIPLAALSYLFLTLRVNTFITPKEKTLRAIAVLLAVGCYVFLFYAVPSQVILKYHSKYALSGLFVLTAVVMMLYHRSDARLVWLLALSSLAALFAFAGSDTGFSPYAIYLLMVVVLCKAFEWLMWNAAEVNVIKSIRNVVVVFWITAAGVGSALLCITYVYRDDANRLHLTEGVSNNYNLKLTYTTASRKNSLQDLLEQTNYRVQPGSVLWAFPDMPMLYYLTQTQPYLDHPWDNLLNAKTIERLLQRKTGYNVLPDAIVHAKGNLRTNDWPQRISPNTEPDFAEKEKTITDFSARYRFQKVWSNAFFELYVKPDAPPR
jgi:hypothetical protein